MIHNSYAEIITYLSRLGELHPRIGTIVVGDSEQVLSVDRSKVQYPLLWIETPSVSWQFSENTKKQFDINIVVLSNAPTDAYQHQQYILHLTLDITEQIIAKLKHDHENNIIRLERFTATADPVLGYAHDHEFGWRTGLVLRATASPCATACVWVDACPVGALAAFTWVNSSLGNFNNIVFTDTSLPAGTTYTTLWTWQVDNGAIQQDKDPPPVPQGAGYFMHVSLQITLGACTLVASAYIASGQSCGESVPYLIEKTYC
jgi:hypothetical protein